MDIINYATWPTFIGLVVLFFEPSGKFPQRSMEHGTSLSINSQQLENKRRSHNLLAILLFPGTTSRPDYGHDWNIQLSEFVYIYILIKIHI